MSGSRKITVDTDRVVVITNGGINFSGLLTALFIGLKLTGCITWSWLWVLSPLWIPIAVVVGFLAIIGVVALIAAIVNVIFGGPKGGAKTFAF